MAAIPPYTTGTATVTSGSAIVTGTGTAWSIAVVNGGVFSRLGLSIPILSIDSATQLTLAYGAPAGMAGTGTYAIDLGRAGAADAVTANARLAQLVSQLSGVSPFGQALIDDASAAAALTTLGVSAYAQTLLDDATAAAARATLGAQAALATGWTAYACSATAQTGAFADAVTTGAFYDVGAVRFYQASVKINNNGTAGGALRLSLPSLPASEFVHVGRETDVNSIFVAAFGSAGVAFATVLNLVDRSYPGANGYRFLIHGHYRTV